MTGKRKYYVLIIGIIIIGIISLGLLLVGGTYAFLRFTATVTNAKYNGTSTCFIVDYNAGAAISGTMFQSKTPKGGLSGTVTMNINANCSVNGVGTIKLNVGNATGTKLFQNNALKYAVYENINSSPVSSGNITAKGEMNLYSNFALSKTAKTYYIYVWLDGERADNTYVDIPFSGYISASATQTE